MRATLWQVGGLRTVTNRAHLGNIILLQRCCQFPNYYTTTSWSIWQCKYNYIWSWYILFLYLFANVDPGWIQEYVWTGAVGAGLEHSPTSNEKSAGWAIRCLKARQLIVFSLDGYFFITLGWRPQLLSKQFAFHHAQDLTIMIWIFFFKINKNVDSSYTLFIFWSLRTGDKVLLMKGQFERYWSWKMPYTCIHNVPQIG